MTRLPIIAAALFLLAGLTSCSSGCLSLFVPKAEQIDSPIVDDLRKDPDEAQSFDHSDYGELLERHVDYDTARVDYAGLKADEAELDAYLDRLAKADLTELDDDGELALLINAYNAYTLKLIVENYPGLESIKDLDNPWKTKRYKVAGYTLSLDDIEHGLIRPIYKDSRIHFAVNCASVGCPPLASWPYEGAKIDKQLDQAAERTLGDERYARVEGDKLYLTSVMNWYRPDFVSDEFSPSAESLPLYAAKYGGEEVQKLVETREGEPAVSFLKYDWALNDVEGARE
ncbi:DUF547 domain-containing protein [Persicimonas caeni]|nr:DUF547 domain-containing protein [Persicimonas caeni]